MTITCDKCNNEFESRISSRKINNEVSVFFIRCPHCKAEYPSYYENDQFRQHTAKIRKLRTDYNKEKNVSKRVKIWEEIEQLTNTNRKISNELKEVFKNVL